MSLNKKHNGEALSLVSNNKGGKISFTGDLFWLIENKPFQRIIIMPLIHYRLRKRMGMIFLEEILIFSYNLSNMWGSYVNFNYIYLTDLEKQEALRHSFFCWESLYCYT